MPKYGPEQTSEDFDSLDDNLHFSDRPSYLPEGIEDAMIPDRLRKETKFWTTGKGQKLSKESAHALMEAEAIVARLFQSGILEEMGLDPQAAKHESLSGHGTRVAVQTLLTNDYLKVHRSPSIAPDPLVLAISSLMHDIGKLRPEINRVVMSDKKWGQDALMQWEIIKQHPTIGAEVAYAMPGLQSKRTMISVANAIFQHHENFDGTGYHGLEGNNICPEARLMRFADCVDTMGESRTYKEPMLPSHIMADIERRHLWYDPAILDVIRKIRTQSGTYPISVIRNSDRP